MKTLLYSLCLINAILFSCCSNHGKKNKQLDRDNPKYKHFLELLESGRAQELLPLLQKQLSVTNDSGYIYALMADANLKIMQFEKALSYADSAVSIDPSFYFGYSTRAAAYDHLGDKDLAISNYNKAITLNPTSVRDLNNLGVLYQDENEHDSAIAILNRAIASDPTYYAAYFNRSISWYAEGKKGLAENDLIFYTSNVHDNPEAYFSLSTIMFSKEDFVQALSNINTAIHLDSIQGRYYWNRGIIYSKTSKNDSACIDITRAAMLGYQPAIQKRNLYCK